MITTKRCMHIWNECPVIGNSSKLSNWILDSVSTCHTTPHVSYFILGSLEDTDKYIQVAGGNHVMAKEKIKVQIKMCNDNGDTFILTFQNLLLAPYLCNRLFSISRLMNLVYICSFKKGFCTFYFGDMVKNAVNFPHSEQRTHKIRGEIKQMENLKEIAPRKEVAP